MAIEIMLSPGCGDHSMTHTEKLRTYLGGPGGQVPTSNLCWISFIYLYIYNNYVCMYVCIYIYICIIIKIIIKTTITNIYIYNIYMMLSVDGIFICISGWFWTMERLGLLQDQGFRGSAEPVPTLLQGLLAVRPSQWLVILYAMQIISNNVI